MLVRRLEINAKRVSKTLLAPLIFRYPPVGLAPERLQVWLRTLIETKDVAGEVLEVGCSLGGTTMVSRRLLRNLVISKGYTCVDTFEGFDQGDFDKDIELGNVNRNRFMFADNSVSLVRKNLDRHGANDVKLIKGDISRIDGSLLPEKISAVLLDIDLAEPIYVGLQTIYARLSEGGIICVDDCLPNNDWQARDGYERFCKDAGIDPRYELGMGIISK